MSGIKIQWGAFGPRKRAALLQLVDSRRFSFRDAKTIVCQGENCGQETDRIDLNFQHSDMRFLTVEACDFIDQHNIKCHGGQTVKTKDVRSKWDSTWHKTEEK